MDRCVPIISFLLALSACGGGSSTDGPPERYGIPPDADPVVSIDVEGGTVYLADGSIYGPCTLIDPHTDDLAGWVSIPPEQLGGDFGFVCHDD